MKERSKNRTSLIGVILLAVVLAMGFSITANAEDPPVYVMKFGGTYGTGAGQFNYPSGIAVDSSGNIWVTDNNQRIQKFSRDGIFISQFGGLGSGNGQFNNPLGVAVDSSDNIYVADRNNNRIQKFNNVGTYISQFGTSGTGNAQFDHPFGVATDSFGNIYIADTWNYRIQKLNSAGTYISQFGISGTGNGQFSNPRGLAVDSSGNIWVADSENNRIQRFNSAGTYISQFGTLGTGNGQFNYAYAIAVDSSGNIFVADSNNHRIQKFDNAGNYLSQFGTKGTDNGQFSSPYGIAVDSSGNIFVADTKNNRVQKFHDPNQPQGTPVISVKQGVTEIANEGSFSFNNVTIGSNKELVFTVSNTGTANLIIPEISSSSANFVILPPPSSVVAPNSSTSFTVRFQPVNAQQCHLVVTISDVPRFSFDIYGTGVGTTPPPVNQQPTVSITCPPSTLTTSSYTFTWKGDDSDGTVSKYFYGLDDSTPDSATTATSYPWTNMSNGSHKFYVKAMDNLGTYSTVKSCNFNVNVASPVNPLPSISISKPLEREVITSVNSELNVAGSAKDDKAISKVEVALNSGSFETVSVGSTGLWAKKYVLTPGANYVVARATDNENAQSSIIVHFTYKPAANQSPSLDYSSGWKPPIPAAGKDYVIKLRADDPDNNLDRIEVDWTGKGDVVSQKATSSAWGEDMTFTRTMSSSKISWSATAYDSNGGKSRMIQYAYPATGLNNSANVKKTNSTKSSGDCKVIERLKNDPVDTLTGAQVISHNLLTVKGVIPISFTLTYNSLVLDKGLIGIGWGNPSGADSHLKVLPSGSVQVYWSNNRVNNFMSNGDNTFSSSEHASRFDKLLKNADGTFTLTRQDKSVYKFNADGQLVERGNQQGQSLSYAYDSAGRLSKITEPVSGVFLSYAYNAEGLLESVSDPMNRKVKLGYDANQNLVTITDVAGNVTTYTYNAIGQTLTGVSAEGKQLFKNTYDDEGRVATQDDGIDGNQLNLITYDEDTEPGKIITTATDRNGGKRVYVYDAVSYQTLMLKDELGKTVAAYEYDEYGNRISATDANGNTTSFAYDAMGHVTSVTDAAGNVTRMTYDSNGNLLSAVNALGKVTSLAYDAKGLLISATDPQGSKTAYSYNSVGQILTVASPAGNVTSFEYQNGLPVRVTNPEGTSRNLQYDPAGRLIRFADAEGNAYTVSYDESCGSTCRTDTITDPLGNTVRKTYDSKGNLLSVTDAKGNISRFTYDNNGNMVSLVNALAQETRYEYDGEDRLIRVIDAKGNVAQMSYDPKGRLVKITDALGNSRQMAYDNTHNLLKKTDALGHAVLSVSYNALDKPVRVSDVLGRSATFDYDALNHLTKTTDPLSRITQLSYDDLGRLVASADAMGGRSSQAFDKDGNLSGFKDPNGNQTGFTFDKNGRLTAEVSASGGQVRYTYTARDLLKQVTNARGQNRQFGYDAAGRVISMTDPDGAVSYAYDKNGNVLTISDSSGTISREYDSLNRVTKYTDAQGNVIRYAYDNVGNMVSMTYPDGKQVAYAYDKIDRLVSVTDWAGRVTRYEYDANNRLTRTVRPNATVMTRSYDNAGQLIQQKDVTPSGEVIVQYDFAYDAAGNITQEKTQPVSEDFPIVPAKMTYSLANRLDTYNGQAVQFDSDGNMIKGPLSGAVKDFQFDSRNRLVQGGTVSYTYTAENSRIAVAENGKKSSFVINPAYLSQVLMKTDADGVKTFYVYGLGLIGQEQAGAYLSYHFDLRGSTVALTDDTGLAADRFQYSAYGESVKHTGTTATPFLYNGRDGVMTDANGLYYMRARYYNPEIKRFVNQDVLLGKVASGQSLNRYAYVNGQPVSYVDPFGLDAQSSSILGVTNQGDVYLRTSKDSHHDFGGATCAYGLGGFCEDRFGYGYQNHDAPLNVKLYGTQSATLAKNVLSQDDNFYYSTSGAEFVPVGYETGAESNFLGIHLGVTVQGDAGSIGGSVRGGLAKFDEGKYGASVNTGLHLGAGVKMGVSFYVDTNEFKKECAELGHAVNVIWDHVTK